MEHLLLKAVATTRDQGLFDAVISSASVDREKDVVSPKGMVDALHRWADRRIPLAWQHSTKAEDQVGYIDPASARLVGNQVVASGWIDQDTEQGKHVWRLAKTGVLAFSFGYLTTKSRPREDGGRFLDEIDLFEITATTTPMNPDTRVIHTKALDDPLLDLRERADAVAREAEEGTLPSVPALKAVPAVQEKPTQPAPVVPDASEQRRKAAEYEHAQDAEDRDREQRQISDIPSLEMVPALSVEELSAPDTEQQWRKAVDTEREQASEVRQREQARIPDVGPEPPPEPEPEPSKPKAVPETQRQRRWARALERKQAKERRRQEEQAIPAIPSEPEPKPDPEPIFTPDVDAQRRKAAAYERDVAAMERQAELAKLETKVSAEPFSTSRTSNWVARGGGLPHFIQHIAHDLMDERGMDESKAIQMAIGICKRWASGGAKVSAKTRAEAAAAIAEWEKLKASSKGKTVDVADAPDTTDLEALVEQLPPVEMLAMFEALYSAASAQAHLQQGKTIPDDEQQRQKARQIEREAARAMEEDRIPDVPKGPGYELLRVPVDEMSGLADGELKAVWSAAAINDLPDSAFLYVESGGKRDADGKTTPRSLRHFPYKGSDGVIDMPHLRNALARIPQSNLPSDVKDRLTSKAQSILAGQSSKSADVADDTLVVRSADLLRQKAEAVALEHASGGESLRKPPQQTKVAPRPGPELSLDDLRQRSRDEMLMALSGLDDI